MPDPLTPRYPSNGRGAQCGRRCSKERKRERERERESTAVNQHQCVWCHQCNTDPSQHASCTTTNLSGDKITPVILHWTVSPQFSHPAHKETGPWWLATLQADERGRGRGRERGAERRRATEWGGGGNLEGRGGVGALPLRRPRDGVLSVLVRLLERCYGF